MVKKTLILVVILGAGFAAGMLLTDVIRLPKPAVALQANQALPATKNNDTADTIISRQIQTPVIAATQTQTIPEPGEQDEQEFVSAAASEAESNREVIESDGEELTIALAVTQQLAAERNARRQLEQQVAGLQNQLQTLEQRFEQLAVQQQKTNERNTSINTTSGEINVETLISAGFDPAQAAMITQTWGQQEMDLLYLRDQASREGWLDSPQYRDAARELRQTQSQLWDELGAEARDRFLYASGQPNRVQVEQVIGSSPAQSLGLQTGDVIVSYDGMPIYSGTDLRSATSNGVPDEQILMQVMRGEQRIEFYIPRGPIGVRVNGVSIEPQS